MRTTPAAAKAPVTLSEVSATRLFTWQVTHHAAVKSTNTGLPSLVSCASFSGEYSTQSSLLAVFATAARSVVASGAKASAATSAPASATQRNGYAPRCDSPSAQAAKPTATTTASASPTPPASTCCASTHSSHTQVA